MPFALQNELGRQGTSVEDIRRQAGSRVNVKSRTFAGGAKGDNVSDDYEAFAAAIAILQPNDVLYIPSGNYRIGTKLTFTKTDVRIVCDGVLRPHGTFDDYIMEITGDESPNIPPGFTGTIDIDGLRINGEFQCRGLKLNTFDNCYFNKLKLYNCYGTSLWPNFIRESTFTGTVISGGIARANFDTSSISDWDSGTSYSVGNIVRIGYSEWDSGTTYDADDYVKGSDENAYRARTGSNLNNDPTSDTTNWVRFRYEYYQCQIANSNQDPQVRNENSATPANRYWIRVYEEEPALNLDQRDLGSGDASNSLFFYGLDVRNCTNKDLILIDTNDADQNGRGFHFIGFHVHQVSTDYVNKLNASSVFDAPTQSVPENGTCFWLQRTRRVKIKDGNLQISSVENGVGIRMGEEGTDKNVRQIRIRDCDILGTADGQVGFLSETSSNTDGSSFTENFFNLTGTGSVDAIDTTIL